MKTRFKNFGFVAAAALWLCWGCPLSGRAAVANVTVNNVPVGFVPATTNIFTGDKVIWTWPAGALEHNVTSTSDPQAWAPSATLNGPATFTNTFTTAGTFPYECTIHFFTGSIVVQAGLAPTVSITGPTNGTVFATPANVKISVAAAEGGGSITNVEFLVGSTVLANETAAPFAATTNILSAGTYLLAAVASDGRGAKATNGVTINVVTPSSLVLNGATRSRAATFQFRYGADSGLSYIVQRSTNLLSTNWQTLTTIKASGSSVNFTDVNATANSGFYRVGRLPNP
ncbi:MAG: Ig-like domain-containing protein [Verrucomicrobiota bacterium]|jgi:plastocyanin